LKDNFAYMLIALLIFLIGMPVALDLDLFPDGIIQALGFSTLLMVGVWSLRQSGRLFTAGIVLVMAGVSMSFLHNFWPSSAWNTGSMLSLLAFMVLATGGAFRQIAMTNIISPNRIVGAICVYLLIGVIWSIGYALLELTMPGSFEGFGGQVETTWNPDWIYYSFVTLTSLGYGDLLPLSNLARTFSYMETVVGQFYLAIMVAGLVSAYLAANNKEPE
jgi:voltage-gated potassium channel